MKILFATTALVIAAVAPAAAATLTTPINANNSQCGAMFDVAIGASALTLERIGANVANGPYTYEFRTRANTVVGHTNHSVDWTLRDTFANVSGACFNALTTFDITDLTVAANSVLGVYFTATVPGVGELQ